MIFIDCPPSLGLLTVNALVAADHALLSSEAQYFALQGVEQALEVVELARDSLNPDLNWLGVLLNIADMRTVHSREAFESLQEHVGDKLLVHTVRQSIAYAESAERAISIFDHRPDLGADYLRVAEELLRRLGLDGAARDRVRRRSSREARLERSASGATARARRRLRSRTARAARAPSRRRPRRAPRPPRRSARSATTRAPSGPAPEIVAPSAPSSRARSTSSIERGIQVRAAVLVQPVARARARRGPSRPGRARASAARRGRR